VKGSIEISPSGEITLAINEGSTFPEGTRRIQELQALLNAAAIPVELAGPIEQHRHDDQPVYNSEQTHDSTTHRP